MPAETRKPRHERRREIADAALRIIGEQGAPALTTATLARAVGLTPGALFRHFASVEDILAAAVDRAIELVEATFPSDDLPPLERLRSFARARIELVSGTPGLAWLLLSDQVYLTVPPAAVDRLRDLVVRSKRRLKDALAEGVDDGSLRADVDPTAMLVLFTGAVHALVRTPGVHRTPPGSAPDPEQVLDALFALLAPTTPSDGDT